MRVVTSPNFCKVCVEGLWHVLLERVSLIDNLTSFCSPMAKRIIILEPVRIGQFRRLGPSETAQSDALHDENILISWSKDGSPLLEFENKTLVIVDFDTTGNFSVELQFSTTEVRIDPNGYLTDSTTIEVKEACELGD